MIFSSMMLLTVVLAPNDARAEHQRIIALHDDWKRIHESGAQDRISADGHFVVDPADTLRSKWFSIDVVRTAPAR